MKTRLFAAAAAAIVASLCGAFPASAEKVQPLAERKALYAPWNPADMAKRRQEQGLIGPGVTTPIPAPAFPSYLKKPDTIDKLMPSARSAARQTGGRTPLGLVEAGKHLLIVVGEIRDSKPNMMVQEAIKRAMEERGAKATILPIWELLDLTKADYDQFRDGVRTYTIADGQRELEYFFNYTGFVPDPAKGREWVRQQDPDLYQATWAPPKFDNPRFAQIAKDYDDLVPDRLNAWLDKHPEISWIVWRSGNRPNTRKMLKQHGERFLGNYTYVDLFDLMGQAPDFPADVWRLVESKTIEPLAYVDRAEVTDPEGTAFGYDISEEASKGWAEGVYNQGHLYMFPPQATGRTPYSMVEYPVMNGRYIPPVQAQVQGVIASTSSHAATYPRIEVRVKDGLIADVKGGGLYGEGLALFQNYPGTKELTWPMQKKPGYWWLYEAGMGTNPKYFKHPGEVTDGNNLSERNVAGVIHWAFGAEVAMGPDVVGPWAKETEDFTAKHNVPKGHSMHQHNLLPTYQVRVRDLDQWITLVEHGGLTSLKDTYARALASRYGNPDRVLNRDYVPELPGVNAPGSYDEYARDPGAYWTRWAAGIEDGTNKFFKP